MIDEIFQEDREFGSPIKLIQNDENQLSINFDDVKYYTIKTTTHCERHGEVELYMTINISGKKYCGVCYAELIANNCCEVQ